MIRTLILPALPPSKTHIETMSTPFYPAPPLISTYSSSSMRRFSLITLRSRKTNKIWTYLRTYHLSGDNSKTPSKKMSGKSLFLPNNTLNQSKSNRNYNKKVVKPFVLIKTNSQHQLLANDFITNLKYKINGKCVNINESSKKSSNNNRSKSLSNRQ